IKSRTNPQPQFSTFLAGAILNGTAGMFTGATESFVVTAPSVPEGQDPASLYSTAIAIGIDWQFCSTGGTLSGIDSSIQNGSVTFVAFTSAFPGGFNFISDFIISEGDNVTMSITATNATSSTTVFTNQSTNQTITEAITSGPLCLAEADFLIDSFDPTPITDFGTINITGASAETPSGSLGLLGATIFDLQQNGTTLTSVTISNSSVQITFL
ncbi:uncharacterized protein PHACADRAFT_91134, partial [Phanerochaete carnosa HHB-10118-sp]